MDVCAKLAEYYELRRLEDALELLSPTTADRDVHIDLSTGDDTSGDGSLSAPYATPIRAWQDYQNRSIRNRIRFLITAAAYTLGSWPRSMNVELGENGSLAIVGVGAGTVIAGPLTVGVVNSIFNSAKVLTIPAGGLTPNAFKGMWLRVLDGPNAGDVQPIISNDATSIKIRYVSTTPPTAGSTIEIIRPSTKIAADYCDISYRNAGDSHTGPGGAEWNNSRLAFINMELDFSGTTAEVAFTVTGNGEDGGISADLFMITDPSAQGVYWRNCSLNGPPHFRDGGAYALSGISAINWQDHNQAPGIVFTGILGFIGRCYWIYDLVCLGAYTGFYDVDSSGGHHHSAHQAIFQNNSYVYYLYSYVENGPAYVGSNSFGVIYKTHVEASAAEAYQICNLSRSMFLNASSTAVNIVGAAVTLTAQCNSELQGANANLGGTAGKYQFKQPNPIITGAAWPAARASATDSQGAWISRSS